MVESSWTNVWGIAIASMTPVSERWCWGCWGCWGCNGVAIVLGLRWGCNGVGCDVVALGLGVMVLGMMGVMGLRWGWGWWGCNGVGGNVVALGLGVMGLRWGCAGVGCDGVAMVLGVTGLRWGWVWGGVGRIGRSVNHWAHTPRSLRSLLHGPITTCPTKHTLTVGYRTRNNIFMRFWLDFSFLNM